MTLKRLLLLFFPIILLSCGGSSDMFRFEGRFRNLNSGEFYVYSPDGGLSGIDTVKVRDGRFSFEMPCHRRSILVLVFPNYSEQPIFAEPGGSVEVKADASHMKEMEVKGTDDNELMNDFRERTANMSPPDVKRFAATMASDHPESAMAVWLVLKYFVNTPQPDYRLALKLMGHIAEKQHDNGFAIMLKQRLGVLAQNGVGSSMPRFRAKAIDGSSISDQTLRAPVVVVSTLASWYYDSEDMQRLLHSYMKRSRGSMRLLTLCLDQSAKGLDPVLKRDSITWPVVCDGLMFDSPTVRAFAFSDLADNIVYSNGRVVGRSLTRDAMRQKLDELIK